jgi:hypothetical protein
MEEQERWKEVCELAAKEQDPKKLMELTKKSSDYSTKRTHASNG